MKFLQIQTFIIVSFMFNYDFEVIQGCMNNADSVFHNNYTYLFLFRCIILTCSSQGKNVKLFLCKIELSKLY